MPIGPPSALNGPANPPNTPPSSGILESKGAMPPIPSAVNAASAGAMALPRFLNTLPTASTAFWNGAGRRSTRLLNSEGIAETTPLAMAPIRGTMFFNAVPMDSANCWLRAPMSAFSLPSPASQFCQAAFIAPTEPSMVLAASSAVVPEMPISFIPDVRQCALGTARPGGLPHVSVQSRLSLGGIHPSLALPPAWAYSTRFRHDDVLSIVVTRSDWELSASHGIALGLP